MSVTVRRNSCVLAEFDSLFNVTNSWGSHNLYSNVDGRNKVFCYICFSHVNDGRIADKFHRDIELQRPFSGSCCREIISGGGKEIRTTGTELGLTTPAGLRSTTQTGRDVVEWPFVTVETSVTR